MKKIMYLASALLLAAGCSTLTQYSSADSDASTQVKMRACLVSEANSRLTAGTLFASSISDTADDMVNTCIQKLALQAAGISEESQSTATSIIKNLQSLTSQN
jgi:hypothetical protein